ncbi:ankyrin-2 ankyrin [Colletotrichum scovillei]|uniref:Ankyrin-2 ankyrin n=1 Tax=Colletotrichum scovillei TaxID=1209932 RepID=A0A9P7U7F4_9PEZI|nr:ankyrin-2 ankyrin [Colletotrichum scovillei]KAG7043120.1 ankyrin-2 ankyrin [Colletotrichum scovillei]
MPTEPLYPAYLPTRPDGFQSTIDIPFFEAEEPGVRAKAAQSASSPSSIFRDGGGARVENITPRVGAEVRGIQLSQLSKAGLDEVALLAAERGVLVFHPTMGYPEGTGPEFHVVYADEKAGNLRTLLGPRTTYDLWHIDQTFTPNTPSTTFFWVLETPASGGGDTAFTSLTAAYAALSPAYRATLRGLRLFHTSASVGEVARVGTERALREAVSTTHPLVIRHPVTGEPSLMDILTAVQLLNSVYEVHHHQRTSLLDILDFQKTPCQSNGPGTQAQLDVPYVSGLHQTLPLLKDRISIALKTRLGHGKTTCLAERMLFENTLTELHSNLPKRPIIDGPVEPHKLLIREQISDLMFRSRSSMSEIITLKAIVSLSTTLSSRLPILLKKFDLYDWSYVEQGFGPEWEKLVPHAVVGCLLFAPGDLYSDSQPYAKIWAHDILVKEGAKYPILARDLALIPPRIRNWSLKELAFLTDHVGPDLKDNQGLTLVHAAILDRRPDIVHQLLEPGGAKPWHRIFRRRFSLFHFAASVGCESCYAELRCHPEIRPAEETRDRNGMLPLHVAALRGQVNVVEAILKAHFDGAEGNEEYVNRETSEAGHTALYLAIARAEDDATARFLAMYPGVDFLVDRQVRQTALHVAASRKRHGLLRFLLCRAPEHQLNVQNEDGETALHIIARHGDRETLNAVLDLPSIELDVTANDGSTPLVDAVTNGNMVAMEALIGCPGVDITALRRPLEPFGFSALEHILQEANGNDGSGGYVDILECLRVRCPELEDDLYEASMAEMETDDGDMEVE